MATRKRENTSTRNHYRYVQWHVPIKDGADGKRHIDSAMMALPTTGTPIDRFEWCKARAAKQSEVMPEQIVILKYEIIEQ